MPDTQREWLAQQVWHAETVDELVDRILAAWPSSPQGLAVKALMEAAAQVAASTNEEWATMLLAPALSAAREAGLA